MVCDRLKKGIYLGLISPEMGRERKLWCRWLSERLFVDAVYSQVCTRWGTGYLEPPRNASPPMSSCFFAFHQRIKSAPRRLLYYLQPSCFVCLLPLMSKLELSPFVLVLMRSRVVFCCTALSDMSTGSKFFFTWFLVSCLFGSIVFVSFCLMRP